ncbi:class F sortase [Luedemannella flava]|uniref:Class F sortase n=1 Tax=Luedemannella flava TaxID=349316 RepID=A0ABN2LX74_9ACTN
MRHRPRAAIVALVLCVVGLFALGIGAGQLTGLPTLSHLWAAHARADADRLHRPSAPSVLLIPEIGVRAEVVPVGLASDGSIAPPRDPRGAAVGWYERGPTPGQSGAAVLVGHVDTRDAPAVFHRLGELRRGELIQVHRRDRHTAAFRVDSVETFPKTAFPVKRIFGDASEARLVLVTCGGRWVGGETGYADNVVVFARRVPA